MKKDHKFALYSMQAKICAAMAHPIRLYILDLIAGNEMNSRELLEVLEIPKANLSQHLSVLKKAGLIKDRKEGTCIYVSLGVPKIKEACSIVQKVLVEKVKQQERQSINLIKELKKKAGNQ